MISFSKQGNMTGKNSALSKHWKWVKKFHPKGKSKEILLFPGLAGLKHVLKFQCFQVQEKLQFSIDSHEKKKTKNI